MPASIVGSAPLRDVAVLGFVVGLLVLCDNCVVDGVDCVVLELVAGVSCAGTFDDLLQATMEAISKITIATFKCFMRDLLFLVRTLIDSSTKCFNILQSIRNVRSYYRAKHPCNQEFIRVVSRG